VYPSAISSAAGENYFFNISDYDKINQTIIEHKDLLSINPIQQLIASVVNENPIVDIDFLSTIKPNPTNTDDQLIVSAHSPVVLGVYDTTGHFTGIDTAHKDIVEQIPGSSVQVLGQDQYIFIPKDGTYEFTYQGTGNGSTTIEVDSFINDVTTPLSTYSDMPTTNDTHANFEINGSDPATTDINIDINGDGTIDKTIRPDGTELSLSELIVQLKDTITSLNLKEPFKKRLQQSVALLEHFSQTQNKKVRKVGMEIQVGLIKWEIEFLERRDLLVGSDAHSLQELLTKIKEKI
jgi:hypothetical protein